MFSIRKGKKKAATKRSERETYLAKSMTHRLHAKWERKHVVAEGGKDVYVARNARNESGTQIALNDVISSSFSFLRF